MSTMNLLFFLSTYADTQSSNNPSLSNFKWSREIDGLTAGNAISQVFTIAPGTTTTLFSGSAIKKIIYLEADQPCDISVNGVTGNKIKPLAINNSTSPGIFVRTSDITALTVTNNGTVPANLFLAAIE